ncbi:MAG TPA: DUF6605 domain-containing protein [Pirellulaceae bacterium]|nr:DUF6605 domain-containing protein [Pirellulaceae bacterium]
MLVGYVSDERYVAVPDALFEFRSFDRVVVARSTISGAIYADVQPGEYQVVLGCDGFGSKLVTVHVRADQPYHFRLLSDGLLGYMWPKCVASGEQSEFRVHAIEEYELELWRYGAEKKFVRRIGTFDEHGPRANMQITPDGDFTQTGIQWNRFGYHGAALSQAIEAPELSGLYYLHARSKSGAYFSFPWIVSPRRPTAPIAVLAADITWNAYNSFGGRSNYIHADQFPETPTVNARLELSRYTDAEHRTYDSDSYQVIDDGHWCFAETGLGSGETFGEKSLHQRIPGGASGHETDKITPRSPPNVRLLAKGTNPDNGGAEIIHFETPNGGQVFSVGSIAWPACIMVDQAVSTITANVIRRFANRTIPDWRSLTMSTPAPCTTSKCETGYAKTTTLQGCLAARSVHVAVG